MLLECAFGRVLGGHSYGTGGRIDRRQVILKLHGSPNFLPRVSATANIRLANNGINVDAQVDVHSGRDALAIIRKADQSQSDLMVPATALYAAGKQVLYCPNTVQKIQSEYGREVAAADRLLILGVRLVADEHIWSPIARSKAKVTYINPSERDRQTFATWAEEHGVNYVAVEGGFEELLAMLSVKPC